MYSDSPKQHIDDNPLYIIARTMNSEQLPGDHWQQWPLIDHLYTHTGNQGVVVPVFFDKATAYLMLTIEHSKAPGDFQHHSVFNLHDPALQICHDIWRRQLVRLVLSIDGEHRQFYFQYHHHPLPLPSCIGERAKTHIDDILASLSPALRNEICERRVAFARWPETCLRNYSADIYRAMADGSKLIKTPPVMNLTLPWRLPPPARRKKQGYSRARRQRWQDDQ